jgi:hypothetical protein
MATDIARREFLKAASAIAAAGSSPAAIRAF